MKMKRLQEGFSLVEVMVASIAFVVIFTGLAGIFKSGVILSIASQGSADCSVNFRDGMKLLREGDTWVTGGPLNSPQRGILAANQAFITGGAPPNRGRLRYQTNGVWYEVWSENGTLLRSTLPAGVPRKIIMGDPTNHILVVPETYVPTRAPPNIDVATIVPFGTKTLVRFNFQLLQDLDGNYLDRPGPIPGSHQPTPEEYVTSYSSSIFLRNSEI